jgi:putative oxidoreductase
MEAVMKSFATALGRAGLALIFILSGVSKLASLGPTAGYMAAKGMPFVGFFLAAAIAIEILGGVSLLLGWQVRAGALALAIFMVPTTLIFHAFWAAPPAEAQIQMAMFLKNVAIFGGLLFIAANGAGPASIDARRARLAGALPESA